MKPYRDTFGNPLSKKDVSMAVQAAVMSDNISTVKLWRGAGLGIGKAKRILELLQQAKVISAPVDGEHKVILRGLSNYDAAVNAALRQLKKGRKGEN